MDKSIKQSVFCQTISSLTFFMNIGNWAIIWRNRYVPPKNKIMQTKSCFIVFLYIRTKESWFNKVYMTEHVITALVSCCKIIPYIRTKYPIYNPAICMWTFYGNDESICKQMSLFYHAWIFQTFAFLITNWQQRSTIHKLAHYDKFHLFAFMLVWQFATNLILPSMMKF